MSDPIVIVVLGSVGACIAVGGLVWHGLQRGIALSRVGDGRAARSRGISLRRGLGAAGDFVSRRNVRRAPPSPADVAALLHHTARQCASGVSFGESFVTAVDGSPLAELFRTATEAIQSGAAMGDALGRISAEQPDVALAVHVLRVCAAQGGAVSESLDRAAATLRERETVAQERLAQSAQARLSARVLTLLPMAFGGWTVLTTPAVRHFFLTPIGAACLLLGLGLNATGWLLMQRVSRGRP